MCQCCRWPLPGSISIDCEDGGSFRHCGECHVVCTHALDLLLIELASDRPGGRCIHRTFDPRRSISHACACTRRMPFSFTPPLSRWLLFFLLLSSFSLRPMSFPPCPSTSSTVSLSDPPLLLSLSLLLRARTRPHDARLVACIDVSDTSMAKGRLGSPLPPSELTRRKKKQRQSKRKRKRKREGGKEEPGAGLGFGTEGGRARVRGASKTTPCRRVDGFRSSRGCCVWGRVGWRAHCSGWGTSQPSASRAWETGTLSEWASKNWRLQGHVQLVHPFPLVHAFHPFVITPFVRTKSTRPSLAHSTCPREPFGGFAFLWKRNASGSNPDCISNRTET